MIQVVEPATGRRDGGGPARRRGGDRRRGRGGAQPAFPAWRALAPPERSALLHRLADALDSHRDTLATLEARNAGKPIGDARGEMGMVVDTFRYYAGAPERLTGKTIPVAGGIDMTFREPLGVVALDHSVELPAHDRLVEGRPGAGGRQHGGAEARRAHAAHRRSSWSGSRSRRACPRAC